MDRTDRHAFGTGVDQTWNGFFVICLGGTCVLFPFFFLKGVG